MTLQSAEALATAHLPQAYRLVITAAGKGLAIGAESHGPDCAGMTLQSGEALAIACLPQAHRLITTATGKGLTVGAESHRPNPISMSPKGMQWETSYHIPRPELTGRRSYRQ